MIFLRRWFVFSQLLPKWTIRKNELNMFFFSGV